MTLYWYGVRKTNHSVVDLYSRHYSSQKNKKTRRDWLKAGITSPAESLTLITSQGDALFVWTVQKYRVDNQVGINCAVFRNESSILSSILILEAESLAWDKWHNENRLFTFVDPNKIKSTNPGYCFIKAGWTRLNITTSDGLIILEKRRIEIAQMQPGLFEAEK